MPTQSLSQKLLDLIHSGDYDIVQLLDDGSEIPYEGCEQNICMVLEDEAATVTKLAPTDPHARKDSNSYSISCPTHRGTFTMIVWEV